MRKKKKKNKNCLYVDQTSDGAAIYITQDSIGDFTMVCDPGPDAIKLLERYINCPLIKKPFWLEQHKKELKELGIKVKSEV